MREKAVISCEIPVDWQAKIDKLATARSKSSEQIFYEAIALYLGEDIANFDNRFHSLEQEVSTLKDTITQLTVLVQDLQQKLTTAAAIINTQSIQSPPISQNPPPVPSPNFEEAELEDEPDEILYDFLEPN